MSDQPNPQKVIYLSPNQKRLPGSGRGSDRSSRSNQWIRHQSDMALDAWGVALRVLRESGKLEGRS